MLVMERLKTIYGILGIKQLSGEALLPIVLLPIIFGIAAMSFFYMMMMCVAVPLLLAYIYWILKKTAPRTKFFYMWALCSIFYLGILFEITVPVLELLPEENFVFILCTFGSLLCFYKVNFFIKLDSHYKILHIYYRFLSDEAKRGIPDSNE